MTAMTQKIMNFTKSNLYEIKKGIENIYHKKDTSSNKLLE